MWCFVSYIITLSFCSNCYTSNYPPPSATTHHHQHTILSIWEQMLGAKFLVQWIGKTDWPDTVSCLHSRHMASEWNQGATCIQCHYVALILVQNHLATMFLLGRNWSKHVKQAWLHKHHQWVSELGFNVPPTTRSYGDGTTVESLIRKTGEAGDQSCDPWIGSLACYPLHHCRSQHHRWIVDCPWTVIFTDGQTYWHQITNRYFYILMWLCVGVCLWSWEGYFFWGQKHVHLTVGFKCFRKLFQGVVFYHILRKQCSWLLVQESM